MIIIALLITYSCIFTPTKINIVYTSPTKYTSISSPYGNRLLYGNNNFHNGVDFLAPAGSEIYAITSGYITYAEFLETGYGNTIIIDHGNNTKSLYSHTSENYIVNVGDWVLSGQIIGYVGPKYLSNGMLNGNTTGPHLHFSVFINNISVDPLYFLSTKNCI